MNFKDWIRNVPDFPKPGIMFRDITPLIAAPGAFGACIDKLAEQFTLAPTDYSTGGPARYYTAAETGGRIGFITPLTHNFCESCNRVRVTCTGTLYMCLGQEDAADLRAPLRASPTDETLHEAIEAAIRRKPRGHDFIIDRDTRQPAVARHMSVTGG